MCAKDDQNKRGKKCTNYGYFPCPVVLGEKLDPFPRSHIRGYLIVGVHCLHTDSEKKGKL